MRAFLVAMMLALALTGVSSPALAQTVGTASNPWAFMPMGYFFGSQAATSGASTTAVVPPVLAASTTTISGFEEFFRLMPMFSLFNISR